MANNPLYNLLGGQAPVPPQMQNMLAQFQRFKSTFRGDPRQQIQQMLNSGQISQAQYNQAVQMANMFQRMLR